MRVLISIQQPVPAWQIPPDAVARLAAQFPDVTFEHATDAEARARGLARCDVAYTWILSADEVAAAPLLRWVHTSAVAVETIALRELFARGIPVSNSRGVQARPIAEHVFAVVLALARQLPYVLAAQRDERWVQNELVGARLPFLLRERTLGLIGVGTIGREVARLAAAFGMRVVAVRRRSDGEPVAGVDEMLGVADLPALLTRADVLVIAAPLTPETDGLLGRAELAQLPRGTLLVNVGRARLLDHDALVDALASGHLAGAALDVLPQEPLPAGHRLWSAPNLIVTPHTSGFRRGHWDEVIDLFAENLARFRRGEPLRYRVRPELGY